MSLHIRTGMPRWKWAPRWCHLDFCNWTWHFADGALAHCFERPSGKRSKSPWKTHKIPVVLKYHQNLLDFSVAILVFGGSTSLIFCDVSALCRLLRYRIILIEPILGVTTKIKLWHSLLMQNTIPRVKFQSKSSTFGNSHDSVEVGFT